MDKVQKIGQRILDLMAEYRKFSALLLGGLLALTLPPYFQFWLAFIAFSGALYICCHAVSLKNLAGIGYCFGASFFAIGFYWIGNALLVDAESTGWLFFPVLLLNGAFFGLFTVLPFMATWFAKKIVAKILFFAVAWCFFTEYTREYLFTGFPWNPISSMLAFRPRMLQTLAWWGTHGLSLVVILMAAWPAIWLVKPNKKTFAAAWLSFVAVAGLWEYGEYVFANRPHVPDGHSLVVRLVQPSISQSLKWDRDLAEENLQSYISLSCAKDHRYVDFTIWGETASPYNLITDKVHLEKVKKAVPYKGYLLTGFLRYETDGDKYTSYNSFGVINRKDGVIATYDKTHLVPFGEYFPLRKYLPRWIRPLTNIVAEFGRGKKYQTIKINGYDEFAPLICYEIIFSGEVLRRKNKPKWIVLLTNDGWYGISSGPYQHLVAAKMRAVEEGVSIVRSANSGISAVLTPYGTVRKHLALGERGFIDAIVKPDEARETLFGRYGNKIPLLMLLALMLMAFVINGNPVFHCPPPREVVRKKKTASKRAPSSDRKRKTSVKN